MATVAEQIRVCLAECITAARKEGYEGTDREYEPTAADCDYVVQQIRMVAGRLPTRDEWLEVLGLRAYIGDAHYEG